MSEKPQDLGLDSKPQAERDRIELEHERGGGNTGLIQRFSVSNGSDIYGENSKEKKAERDYRFMLDMLLMEDAQYAQLYYGVQDKLDKAYQAVGKVLIDINQHLLASDQMLENFRDQAAELEDGTKVFMSSDGSIYTENGQRLSEKNARKITIPEGAPSWKDYHTEKEKRDVLLRDKQEIKEYKHGVLDDIDQQMKDKDNPPTVDELEDFFQNRLDINNAPSALKNFFGSETSEQYGAESEPAQTKELIKGDIPEIADEFSHARLGLIDLPPADSPQLQIDKAPAFKIIP